MTPKQFDKIANELFGTILTPLGFSSERSRFCTFHRQVSDEVCHIIVPDPGSRTAWYDIKVFPVSPILAPSFESQFPDNLGIPSDVWSYLNEHGVGLDQQKFNCKNEENMRRRFESTVKQLLLRKAVTYLDGFHTVRDMLPIIKHSSFLGLALHHVGRLEEAKISLNRERDRLSRLDQSDSMVSTLLSRVNQLLSDS